MADSMETKLKNGPEDGISSVVFSPGSSQFLLVSSWDSTVRLYDVIANTQRLKYTHERAVLDICFQVTKITWDFTNVTYTFLSLGCYSLL
jgi:cell cycle arrest protein BUB3